jgi:peptidoglycan/xylan/chitin deacetylase (PgdA/CDA1 family)
MRQRAKSVLEVVACASGIPRLMRRRHSRDTLILAYHNIVPDGEPVAGDVSLHLPQRTFARQLDLLCQTHQVVPLREALRPARSRGRPRAVITFDDATQGAVTAGVSELVRRRLPATVFVAPAFVGGRAFWWDAIESLTPVVRDHCLQQLQGRDEAVREWATSHSVQLRIVPMHQTCATEEQLRAVQGERIELGSHTWSHPNLASLSDAELEVELVRPLEWLRARFHAVIPWLAYPYGMSSSAAATAAALAGYEAGLRVDGGWLRAHAGNRYALPRQNVPAGLTDRGFRLLSSGVVLRR